MINSHTVERLVIYNRILKQLERGGVKWVTSSRLAGMLSKTPAQVRKDLSVIGRMGKPGVGYNIVSLREDLDRIIGLDRTWGVAVIGAGNLGRALFNYPGFREEGFRFLAVYDKDPAKIGRQWNGVTVSSLSDISKLPPGVHIAVIAVPASSAQEVVSMVIEAGIREILNFAPVNLSVPEDVNVRYVDLALEFENLSFFLSSRNNRG